MANYTYGGGLVISSENMLPIASQTGILLDQVGGTEHPVTDLQGTATLVTTNDQGFFADFVSDLPRGVLMFGSYAHPVISDTMIEQAAQASTTASSALSTANAAKTAADAATTGLAGKADINHTHDGRYALADHNHSGVYSSYGHNHDSTYLPISPPLSARMMSADQSIPNVTSTPLVFGTQEIQTGGMIYSSANEWLIPKGGRWAITGIISFAYLNSTTWNLREVRIFINNTQRLIISEDRTAAANLSIPGRIFAMSAGDKVRIEASQHTGGSLAVKASQTWVHLAWIGA